MHKLKSVLGHFHSDSFIFKINCILNHFYSTEKNSDLPFFVFNDFLHNVEKIPSVQSLVDASNRPNICGAVIAFGFILISRCGCPQSPIAFINMFIHAVLPAPAGPSAIIPWRTRCVSYN